MHNYFMFSNSEQAFLLRKNHAFMSNFVVVICAFENISWVNVSVGCLYADLTFVKNCQSAAKNGVDSC